MWACAQHVCPPIGEQALACLSIWSNWAIALEMPGFRLRPIAHNLITGAQRRLRDCPIFSCLRFISRIGSRFSKASPRLGLHEPKGRTQAHRKCARGSAGFAWRTRVGIASTGHYAQQLLKTCPRSLYSGRRWPRPPTKREIQSLKDSCPNWLVAKGNTANSRTSGELFAPRCCDNPHAFRASSARVANRSTPSDPTEHSQKADSQRRRAFV
jgi:hypothetical protein